MIKNLKKGTLTSFGYSSKIKLDDRRKALTKAVKKLSPVTIIRKLNAVSILNKNTNPKISNIFKKDLKWISKKFIKK